MDDLAKIKERERAAREAIARGDERVPVNPQFTKQQLGLVDVMADSAGRLWYFDGAEIVRIKNVG